MIVAPIHKANAYCCALFLAGNRLLLGNGRHVCCANSSVIVVRPVIISSCMMPHVVYLVHSSSIDQTLVTSGDVRRRLLSKFCRRIRNCVAETVERCLGKYASRRHSNPRNRSGKRPECLRAMRWQHQALIFHITYFI